MTDDDVSGDGRADAPGGFDLGGLLEQAQRMQQQLMEAQAAAAEQEVEGSAGGGVVRVRVTGGMEFRAVTIDPEVVDANDVTMLEDLVLAALHDAVGKVHELSTSAMGGLDLGALGLGGPTGPGGPTGLGGPAGLGPGGG